MLKNGWKNYIIKGKLIKNSILRIHSVRSRKRGITCEMRHVEQTISVLQTQDKKIMQQSLEFLSASQR